MGGRDHEQRHPREAEEDRQEDSDDLLAEAVGLREQLLGVDVPSGHVHTSPPRVVAPRTPPGAIALFVAARIAGMSGTG